MSADSKRVRLVIGRSPHFRELPAATLDRLASMASVSRHEDGEHLHAAWQPVTQLWIVLRGGLRCTISAPDGTPFLVAVLHEGGYFGVSELVSEGVAAEADAYAVGPTELGAIEISSLRAEAGRDRVLEAHLLKLVGQRYRAAVGLYRDAVTAPLGARVARRLLSAALATGRDGDGAEIELRLSQSDLAEMLGASRSKVGAELRRLEAAGALRLGYRTIVVSDVKRLSGVAGADVTPI